MFVDRSQFASQLRSLDVRLAFAGRLHTEVGSQGLQAQIAWVETTFNRAAARNQSLMKTLSGSYFPTSHPGRSDNPHYHAVIYKVFNEGTNITNGATGNASGTVGFGGGPQMYAANGERFGVEGVDKPWWKRIFPTLMNTARRVVGFVGTMVKDGLNFMAGGDSTGNTYRPQPQQVYGNGYQGGYYHQPQSQQYYGNSYGSANGPDNYYRYPSEQPTQTYSSLYQTHNQPSYYNSAQRPYYNGSSGVATQNNAFRTFQPQPQRYYGNTDGGHSYYRTQNECATPPASSGDSRPATGSAPHSYYPLTPTAAKMYSTGATHHYGNKEKSFPAPQKEKPNYHTYH
ncbi:MAG: hypothetical protein EB059_01830 [Alphaproteobacteria bacterium]|nr:hypothetical protein [Alphaproteobacteria bacterium]